MLNRFARKTCVKCSSLYKRHISLLRSSLPQNGFNSTSLASMQKPLSASTTTLRPPSLSVILSSSVLPPFSSRWLML